MILENKDLIFKLLFDKLKNNEENIEYEVMFMENMDNKELYEIMNKVFYNVIK